jgi:hypothetical protein
MTLINGPHDGDHAPGPAHGQIGLLTPLSPGKFGMRIGEPAAVYIPVAGAWVFWKYIPRGCGHEVWERLMWRALA